MVLVLILKIDGSCNTYTCSLSARCEIKCVSKVCSAGENCLVAFGPPDVESSYPQSYPNIMFMCLAEEKCNEWVTFYLSNPKWKQVREEIIQSCQIKLHTKSKIMDPSKHYLDYTPWYVWITHHCQLFTYLLFRHDRNRCFLIWKLQL